MRKKNRQTTFASIVIILAFFGIRMMFDAPDKVPNFLEQSNLEESIHYEKAVVVEVIDGDTIWTKIDGKEFKIRFIGVNTPEKNELNYQEATDYTKKMLQGKIIYLEKDISDTDQYGRLLRYIWLEVPKDESDLEKREKLFNSMLLENGFAEIAVYKPDIKYLDYYKRLMNDEVLN